MPVDEMENFLHQTLVSLSEHFMTSPKTKKIEQQLWKIFVIISTWKSLELKSNLFRA